MSLNAHWFLRKANRFPWGILGIDYPGLCCPGALCLKLCRVALIFAPPADRRFLASPSSSELKRFFTMNPENELLGSLVSFLGAGEEPKTKGELAECIVEWLSTQERFLVIFQKELDRLHQIGVLSVPREALDGSW